MPSKHKDGDVERLTDMAFPGFQTDTELACTSPMSHANGDNLTTTAPSTTKGIREERSRLRLGTFRRTIYDSTVPPPTLPTVPQRHSLYESHMNDEPMRHTMRPMRTEPGKRRGLYEFASEESAARPLHETMPGHRSRDTVQTTA